MLLVPTSVLFVNNKFSRRKKLVEKYSIRGIITLKNSFFSVYAMQVSIIILDEKARNVWLTSTTCTDDIIVILSIISQYKRKVYYTDMYHLKKRPHICLMQEPSRINRTKKSRDTSMFGDQTEDYE